jgi:hypothetical protein
MNEYTLSNLGYLQYLSLILIPTIVLVVAAVLISRKHARRTKQRHEQILITERLVQAYITIADLHEDATKVNPADIREALHTITLLGPPEVADMARQLSQDAPAYNVDTLGHLLRTLRLSLRDELKLP